MYKRQMFVSQTQEELYDYFAEIAASTKLPIILYNNAPKTNVTIAPGTVARLAEIDNIIAVKDSTGDMTNTAEYIRLTRDNDNFHVLDVYKRQSWLSASIIIVLIKQDLL